MRNHRNQHKRRRLTKPERMKILKKTNGHCAYCGCKIEYNEMQIDHVVPIRNGGKDSEENMLPACRSCNHQGSVQSFDFSQAYREYAVSFKPRQRYIQECG